MSFRIRFTDTAKEALRSIALYIAEQSGEKSIAIKFVNELREKTKILEDFPEIGAVPDDRIMKSMEYHYLIHKDYLIFYHVESKEETAYILAVFNVRRDYTRVMRKFLK
ncbi:MAG: type II toxin-antitoxin system RelE/ParE family toxin [Ruminococcaceae bacterium]|nr:type II toxin-antitoxin system RelE/ParE family toxin [Oscillospiraceae bacterium]